MAPVVGDEAISPMDFAGGIFKRWPRPTSTSSPFPTKSCTPDDDSPICQKPVSASSNTTLPIVLGVVIPITVALAILLFLHRRHVRRLRNEDAEDKNKSLDFGMGDVIPTKKKRGKRNKGEKSVPEMSFADTQNTLRRSRGVSMDLTMNHPYVLPPEVHQSKDSLHSMSRTINTGDDKYRPATTFIPNSEVDLRYASRNRGADDSSSYTDSTRPVFADKETESHRSLLRNAERMSRSGPPTRRTSVTSVGSTPAFQDLPQPGVVSRKPLSREEKAPENKVETTAPVLWEPNRHLEGGDAGKQDSPADIRKSNNYLGALIQCGDEASLESQTSKGTQQKPVSPPPGPSSEQIKKSPPAPVSFEHEPLNFDFPTFDEPPHSVTTTSQPNAAPETNVTSPQDELHLPEHEQQKQDSSYDVRRLTMGIRPLPPDDPTEDPEQRANRIRSFYKEYFDEAKQGPFLTGQHHPGGRDGFGYGNNVHDEFYGQPIYGHAPYAQPMARRAMTPPPRGTSGFSSTGRTGPSRSGAYSVQGGARAYSSVSGKAHHGLPRKHLPPPSPLPVLPTPHLLKDDSVIPMDFAPPSPFRERRAGTPDSLRGGMRPYSPTVPAHLPLASSFDDLTAMPSPHALRKSGAFTALDFAPPPRLRSSTDTRSDAGSIRSNRSAMSAAQLHSIRAGAYRVSRIPQELGGTKHELAGTLRPNWDMRK